MRRLLILSLLLPLTSCGILPAVGPNYQRVKMELPEVYLNTPEVSVCSTLPYWQRLGDPILSNLEQKALNQNLNLKQAWQRIEQARAQAGMAIAGLGPTVSAQGGYQGTRYGAENNPVTPSEQTLDIYALGLTASWEIDIFGGNRRAHEAARSATQIQEANAAAIRSSLMAEVARQYFTYMALKQRLHLLNSQIEASSKMENLSQKQQVAGLIDNLSYAQIRSRNAQIVMQKPLLESALTSTQYALEALLAEKPGGLTEELSPSTIIPAAPPLTSIPLPSQLLTQRPDVIAADRSVAATTAQIGVATADLFPKFNLTGSYGVQADSPSKFDSPQALTWHGGPTFSWTLFSTGKILNNITFTKARQKEAVLAYQQTVLNALADVESKLKHAQASSEAAESAQNSANAMMQRAVLAQTQYEKGLLNGFEKASIDLESLQAQDMALQSRLQSIDSYINLYHALGL